MELILTPRSRAGYAGTKIHDFRTVASERWLQNGGFRMVASEWWLQNRYGIHWKWFMQPRSGA
jgi:hypothetical protein